MLVSLFRRVFAWLSLIFIKFRYIRFVQPISRLILLSRTPRFHLSFNNTKLLFAAALLCITSACAHKPQQPQPRPAPVASAAEVILDTEITRVDAKAQRYLTAQPMTVPAVAEGESPLLTDKHRQTLVRFSDISATLTSAYLISGNPEYANKVIQHLRAWFVVPETRTSPKLEFVRADDGAGSVMDTIHLTEIARSVKVLSAYKTLSADDEREIKTWFSSYLSWLNKNAYGAEDLANDEAVAWAMQAAAIADLLGDRALLAQIRDDFKTRFVGEMMATDGSFPSELKRANSYSHSLFILDAMATIAQIASTETDDLWTYRTADGRGMTRAVEYMLPYISQKNLWPLPADEQYWEHWPVRRTALAFAALAYTDRSYLTAWQPMEADPEDLERLFDLPVRHPLLWLANNLPQVEETVAAVTTVAQK